MKEIGKGLAHLKNKIETIWLENRSERVTQGNVRADARTKPKEICGSEQEKRFFFFIYQKLLKSFNQEDDIISFQFEKGDTDVWMVVTCLTKTKQESTWSSLGKEQRMVAKKEYGEE